MTTPEILSEVAKQGSFLLGLSTGVLSVLVGAVCWKLTK